MNKKALIVDDEAQVRNALAAALGRLGWETEGASAASASDALAAAEGTPFSMIFLPISSEAFGSLSAKARKASRTCLVVALADLDCKDELRRAVFTGMADEFLPLPFSQNDIADVAKLARGAGK